MQQQTKYPYITARQCQRCVMQSLETLYLDGLMQERCNSSALAMELHLSCPNPLIFSKESS